MVAHCTIGLISLALLGIAGRTNARAAAFQELGRVGGVPGHCEDSTSHQDKPADLSGAESTAVGELRLASRPFCSPAGDKNESRFSSAVAVAGKQTPQPARTHLESSVTTNSAPSLVKNTPISKSDLNRDIYYKNKIEFSLDGGWLPINIPFVFDVFLGDSYNMTSRRYTLVPLIGSLRWQMDDADGPWIFRGNWDLTASAAVTLIPSGPETRYLAWIMGVRRNFVPRRSRIAPYFDGRLGLGRINAKEPAGVAYAQGQDFTFTINMGSGIRYNFNPRYSVSAGLNWMHISNLYLSEPQFSNYGINVYGPMFGINVRLGKPGRRMSE
jgi:hypothetical protein